MKPTKAAATGTLRIHAGVQTTIGHTPLVELQRIGAGVPGGARLLAKLESRNPGGSVKDRIAAAMIADAERTGALEPGAPSSRRRAATRASRWPSSPPPRATPCTSPCPSACRASASRCCVTSAPT